MPIAPKKLINMNSKVKNFSFVNGSANNSFTIVFSFIKRISQKKGYPGGNNSRKYCHKARFFSYQVANYSYQGNAFAYIVEKLSRIFPLLLIHLLIIAKVTVEVK